MRLLALLILLASSAAANATTMWVVGNGTATITPRSSATWTVQAFGAGQSGNDSTGAGGNGGSWAQSTFVATNGVAINFSLGAPGAGVRNDVSNGGDTWFSSAASLLAPGGGSATAAIGTSTFAGGIGGTYTTQALPGGGGAAGPHGAGHAGGSPTAGVCVPSPGVADAGGGGGGGGNGGGTDGDPCVPRSTNGGNGGAGFAGAAGAGGVGTGAGAQGGPGAGGGGGAGDGTTFAANGGNGGDDYDNGGGGGGGSGSDNAANTLLTNGTNGGTPGGGGTTCFAATGGSCTYGSGGWSVIKITYTGSDADQIYELGTIPMPVNIPASWTAGYTTTTAGSVTILTKNAVTPAGQRGFLMLLGVGQ
jgi:hypothetical protein